MKILKGLLCTSLVVIGFGFLGIAQAIEWREGGNTIKRGGASAAVASESTCEKPSDFDYAAQNYYSCIKELKGVRVVKYSVYYNSLVSTPMFVCSASMVSEADSGMHFDVTPFLHPTNSLDLLCPLLQQAAISKTKLDVLVVPAPGIWSLMNASTAAESP